MTTPLTLRFVLQHYFPYGGQQRDFLKIAQAALAHGHRVQAIVQTWEGDEPAGIEVIRLAVKGWSNHRRLQNFAEAVQHFRARHPVDVQVGFVRMPGLDVYFAADPCYRARALRRSGIGIRLLPRFRVLSQLEAAVFGPQADTAILALTESESTVYQRCYGTPAERFTLLPPGVTDQFQPASAAERGRLREQFGVTPQTRLMLMVGSHFRTKGVDRSLLAVAALPAELRQNCLLWIAGAGKIRAMQALTKTLGIETRVSFLGGRGDVPSLMQAADLLLQPSRTELAGMSIVEALSSGLPVIVSGECGYAHHVQRAQAGIAMSTPFTQADFNRAIQSALASDCLNSWRDNAKQYGANNRLRGMAGAALAVIEQIGSRPERKRL